MKNRNKNSDLSNNNNNDNSSNNNNDNNQRHISPNEIKEHIV